MIFIGEHMIRIVLTDKKIAKLKKASPSVIPMHRYELAAELQAVAQRTCLQVCVPFDQPLS